MIGESKHFVLAPVGSAGDVHPFLGIGGELRSRGHRVTLLAGETFRGAADRAGFDFIANWSEMDAHPVTSKNSKNTESLNLITTTLS